MISRSPIFINQVDPRFLAIATFAVAVSLTAQLVVADVDVVKTFGTNNVAVSGQFAFATGGTQGLVIVDLETHTVADIIPSPAGTNSIDDVSIDGDLLFVLDAAGAGALSVFSLDNPTQPMLVAGPVSVAVGPFAGVSAANGRVVVSGGTGLLSVRSYGVDGSLAGPVSTIDLGVGQPDVLVADDGDTGFVSTDFAGFVNGQSFGITVIDISATPTTVIDQIGIAGAGFSPGTDGPANFPIESAIQGDALFVASGDGTSIFDVSDPGSVQTIGKIPLSTNPVNVDVHNDTLFVVGNSPSPTLTVIDIADLNSPVVETISLPSRGRPLGVATTSTSVVIADATLGVLVDSLFLPGDLNRDGAVNLLDVAPFVELLGSGGFQIEGDINGDEIVNLLDVTPFVELLAS